MKCNLHASNIMIIIGVEYTSLCFTIILIQRKTTKRMVIGFDGEK